MHLRVSMTIGTITSKFSIKRGLLPALCAVAALAAAILTVKADEPGSGAADETGMGNSYEYPNGTQKPATPHDLKAKNQRSQRAGEVASSSAPAKEEQTSPASPSSKPGEILNQP